MADPDDHQARAGAAGFLGLASWTDGDVIAAAETFSQAIASIRAAGHLADELTSTVVLADMWLAGGRPTEARRLVQGALEHARASAPATLRGTADLHVALSEIDLEAGELSGAKQHLENAKLIDQRLAMGESRFRLFVAMARVAAAEGDVLAASDHLDRAEQLSRVGFVPQLRPISAMRARMSIAQGNLAEAAAWATAAGVTATDEVHHLREFELLTLVRLLNAQHRDQHDDDEADQAATLLGRLRVAAETSGRQRTVVETHVLSALALDRQGRRQEAVESLERAWDDAAEPDSHVRLLLDEGAPMLELLRAAARSSPARHVPSGCSTSTSHPRTWTRRCLERPSALPGPARSSTR